ncbi:hypothetical protein NG726_27635 [Pseudomonas sp. MOB-449]|nr:hypothetical protein [Pseudomonas sp. MOB-449]
MKLSNIAVVPLMLALCAGCAKKPEERIRELLIQHSNLFDPASAMSRNIVDKGNDTYCFDLNAKNRLGGYVGWRRTYLSYSNNNFYMQTENISDQFSGPVDDDFKDTMNVLFQTMCDS